MPILVRKPRQQDIWIFKYNISIIGYIHRYSSQVTWHHTRTWLWQAEASNRPTRRQEEDKERNRSTIHTWRGLITCKGTSKTHLINNVETKLIGRLIDWYEIEIMIYFVYLIIYTAKQAIKEQWFESDLTMGLCIQKIHENKCQSE